VWLWVGGRCVGETHEVEIVEFGLNALQEAVDDPDPRTGSILASMSAEEALNLVMWARYGDDDPALEAVAGSRQALEPYEILPRRTGVFFDHWQAVLLEQGETETMIFRRTGQPVSVVKWSKGTFASTVCEARRAFRLAATGEDIYASG
jgi:hypothetical protein